jgi:FkbM family methyltransferase
MATLKAQLLHWSNFRFVLRHHFGYRSRILWNILYPIRSHVSFGLSGLDQQILKIVGQKKGFYIELGANDGFTQSNTLRLEMFHGWRGLLIEPVSSSYSDCLKNRSLRRNAIVRAACVSDSYERETVELSFSNKDRFSKLWASPLNVETTTVDPLRHGQRYSDDVNDGKHHVIEVAPARTLSSILDEVGAPEQIRLLSLDVEGGELEVLKGLDLSRYSIEWLVVETRNLDAVVELLAPSGYLFHSALTHWDYVFRGPTGD